MKEVLARYGVANLAIHTVYPEKIPLPILLKCARLYYIQCKIQQVLWLEDTCRWYLVPSPVSSILKSHVPRIVSSWMLFELFLRFSQLIMNNEKSELPTLLLMGPSASALQILLRQNCLSYCNIIQSMSQYS